MAYLIVLISLISIFIYFYEFYKADDILLILPIFYNFVVCYVILGTCIFTYAREAPFGLYDILSEYDLYKGSFSFILASLSFYFGASIAPRVKRAKAYIFTSSEIKYQKSLVFLVFFIYLVYIIGYGVEPLIHRRGYIDASFQRHMGVLIIFFVCSPFVTVLIPFIKKRLLRYTVFLVCFLILFSSSSRFVVMVPFLYMIGTFLRFGGIKVRVILSCIILIFTSLIFVLQIRYYIYHGLIPNLTSLFTKGLDSEYLFTGLNYAFSFSLFGVSYVLNNFTHDAVAFFISINPLPSRFLDIEYMLEVQEMKKTAPISALATLSLAGYPILISFYFVTGYFFSIFMNKMKGVTILYYIVVGLFILFSFFSIQYNLRGLSRFFYYSIVIYLFHITFKKVKIKKRCKCEHPTSR
ncbi:hypothetical protein MUS1_03095 [Marinomonas ushuaiensis DSM 15871]|uniref:Oligosaccharide repeat unit polymerase n=1 Tax=Marinomonas ushuaiensis DSM 15871 TaxID=1122207 RepID=X7EBJ5_9GAMM|nr:hypothetical protein MUS1_03095 [Marinomonas ushuaiensis DSM 15871]